MPILMVILFMRRLSTHSRMLPSFFGTERASTAHGLRLSLMKPLDTNSSTGLWTSIVCLGFILHVGLLGRMALMMRFIWCWMDHLGGNLGGMSFRKT